MTVDQRTLTRLAAVASGERLRHARELCGWTQTELAERLDGALTSPAISMFESGKTKTSGPTLGRLAHALQVPPTYLVARGDDDAPGFFRSLKSAPVKARRQALAQAQLLHDLAVEIEKQVRLPRFDESIRRASTTNIDEIDEIAANVRNQWSLGDEPIKSVVRTIEQHGVIVARIAVSHYEIDAFSVLYRDRPVVILGSDKGATARSRFDAAHELGHIVMHDWLDADTKQAETQAHRFAAAFLLPRHIAYDVLPAKVDWKRLIALKAIWGVSLAALLYRMKALGVITEPAYVSALKTMSARGWRTTEPGDHLLGRLEQPTLLTRAIDVLEQDGTSLHDFLRDASLPEPHVRKLLGATDSRPVVDI